MSRLKMDPLPLAIVGGDEGFTGKPTPAIFLEAARRIGVAPDALHRLRGRALRHRGRAPRRHARRGRLQHPHRRRAAGPHVIAAVRDYNELAHSNFLETLDAAA